LKSHLATSQLKELRQALEDKRAQLLRTHQLREQLASETDADAVELEEVAEGVIEDRERAALEEHDRRLLEQIEHALDRFDEGSYGTSEASGRPIPFERLRAVPWGCHDADEEERIEAGHSSPPGR
jgi:DnaK suppressor protein